MKPPNDTGRSPPPNRKTPIPEDASTLPGGMDAQGKLRSHSAGSADHSATDRTTAPSAPPEELARHPRYEILQVLGSGGMGTVYKARHRFMDRIVALKVVHPRLLDLPEMVARFEAEIRLAARLVHPNIVTAYDAEAYGSLHFLVMEFIDGQNLADRIAAEGPLPVERACDHARQVALGLQYAHEQGMVHRDVKPHNLICTETSGLSPRQELVKILDFGLARMVRETQAVEVPPSSVSSSAAALTGEGAVLGTWNYMAPEQAEDSRTADIRADIYALGCTLYHLLLGRPPFRGLSSEERRQMHRDALLPPLTDRRFDVSPELAAIVARMMAWHPADRYQTPAEVATALAALPACSRTSLLPTANAPSAPSPPAEGRPLLRRRFLQAGAALGVVAGAAALAGYHYFRRPASPSSSGATASSPRILIQSIRLQVHRQPVFSLAFSSDGCSLVAGSRSGAVSVWDWRRQQRHELLHGHTGPVRGVAFLKGNQRVLSAAEDGTVRVWDAEIGRETARFPTEPADRLTSLPLSADGRLVLCGGQKHTWLWEVSTGRRLQRLPHRTECVAFAPDGRRAAGGGWEREVYVWDVDQGRLLRTLAGHTMGIKGVAFSSDGTQLLSGGEDRTICLWDAVRYQLTHQWRGHKHWVWSAGFLPDGRALTASWDRTARVWDVSAGRELLRLTADPESDEFTCQAISPDGRWAACADAGGIVYLWELPP